jgi:hypothetical protein
MHVHFSRTVQPSSTATRSGPDTRLRRSRLVVTSMRRGLPQADRVYVNALLRN